MTTNSSNSSNPSAGTARPPAAPHPLAAIDNIFRFAREECYPDELEIVEAAEAYVAALRSALAEREAECERLRADAERYRAIREMGWSVEFNGLWTGAAAWRVHDDELRYHHAPSLDDAVDKARTAPGRVDR